MTVIVDFGFLQELNKGIQEHTSSLDYINKTGHELISKSSPERAQMLQTELDQVNSEWAAVAPIIEQRQAKLEKSISYVRDFMVGFFDHW